MTRQETLSIDVILDTSADDFVRQGWALADLPDQQVVLEARDLLLRELERLVGGHVARLVDDHLHVEDDDTHIQMQQSLSEFYWAKGIPHRVVAAQKAFLTPFFGPDLLVQTYPYLRMARPGRRRDNIGFHRDTHHGSSPFEVSMFLTFTDLDEASAFRVVTGSHADPESAYPYEQVEDPVVSRGSTLHKLGFPYAPKLLRPEVAERSEPVPVRVGQALYMSLGLVHGQEVNAGTTTRISSDIRVANALAPVPLSRGVRSDYYTLLSSSPVTIAARQYLQVNESVDA